MKKNETEITNAVDVNTEIINKLEQAKYYLVSAIRLMGDKKLKEQKYLIAIALTSVSEEILLRRYEIM